jgi:hypothetical protein
MLFDLEFYFTSGMLCCLALSFNLYGECYVFWP